MRKTEYLEEVCLYKSTEKEMNELVMDWSDQECDDGVDIDGRKRGGLKAVTGHKSRSLMAM